MNATKKVRIIANDSGDDQLFLDDLNAVLAKEEADGWHVKYTKPFGTSGYIDRVFVLFTHAPWPKEQEHANGS